MDFNLEEEFEYRYDKLFEYQVTKRYAVIWGYFQRDNPEITKLQIPEEFNGKPVTRVFCCADNNDFLREVYIPDSVKFIDGCAFYNCPELREVRLPAGVELDPPVFINCPKLPSEKILAGLVGSADDISAPLKGERFDRCRDELFRTGVFELAIKYDSLREIGTDTLFIEIVLRGLFECFDMLERAGKSPSAEMTDAMIEFCALKGKTEMTAFLLDYKNRKFGFKNGGGKFEL